MRVLLDTNVLLDVLLQRAPWVTDSSAVWQAHDQGQITGFIMACAIPDVFYIARRLTSLDEALGAVRVCLEAFDVCAVDRQALSMAYTLSGRDFEDNLQMACASIAGVDAIVTRDAEGFRESPVPILAPGELLARLEGVA